MSISRIEISPERRSRYIEKRINELSEILADEDIDYERVRVILHQLLGSSATFGFGSLEGRALVVQQALKEEQLDTASKRKLIYGLMDELNRCLESATEPVYL